MRVAALNAADVCRLIQVALQASLVGQVDLAFCRVQNVRGAGSLGVFAGWTMAGFARIVLESAFLVGLYYFMKVLLEECFVNIFMAHLAGL